MIFGIFKDKGAENIASMINEQHNKLYSLAKKDKIGIHVIKRSIFEKEYSANDLKITKKFVEWKVYVEDIFVNFVTEPKNKDEIYVSLQGRCLSYPECVLTFICFDKKKKWIHAVDNSDNKKGIAVKDILINKYGWKDQLN